jgi:hypothetical protein
MIKLKTTKKVTIDPITQFSDYVNARMNSVSFNGETFSATISYSDSSDNLLASRTANFSLTEAIALDNAMSPIGDSTPEKYKDLIIKATIHTVKSSNIYGINSSDWEIVE